MQNDANLNRQYNNHLTQNYGQTLPHRSNSQADNLKNVAIDSQIIQERGTASGTVNSIESIYQPFSFDNRIEVNRPYNQDDLRYL